MKRVVLFGILILALIMAYPTLCVWLVRSIAGGGPF